MYKNTDDEITEVLKKDSRLGHPKKNYIIEYFNGNKSLGIVFVYNYKMIDEVERTLCSVCKMRLKFKVKCVHQ